ncbi:diaminopimelate epimerase [Corynebacterium aquilae]|uniref:Diaminopimelate epimerase n=1 Tax=Corynebacterium aquilae DSM 44791 TaxID=1431546 RepID=A0A1L7CGP5_9CORY|nr:diaminopimelate epimerase [Corynebacterium aquilae]APT84923.1 diaminopimelate epimerase [Corynebacterium aquilae DSM 44791]
MTAVPFAIGHGTENDFVILPDAAVHLDLTENTVRALCDRRAGIGGDGVLRVATAQALLDAHVIDSLPDGVSGADWFMDYRNADGSIAEMCGNGVRVFAHWVRSRGLVTTDTFVVGTRAGARPVTVSDCTAQHATVTVGMGNPHILGTTSCTVTNHTFSGLGVDMGNPHLACVEENLTPKTLADLPIEKEFTFDPEFFPEGVNIEVLTPLDTDANGNHSTHMRVHERGAGETRSCGTGTVAAATAALAHAGETTGTVTVHVPGGTVTVTIDNGTSTLTGPSVIVATGSVELETLNH